MVTDRSQQHHLTQRIVKKGVAARAGIGMIFVSDSTTLGSKRYRGPYLRGSQAEWSLQSL